MKKLLKTLSILILLGLFGCSSSGYLHRDRREVHVHTYKDLHGKWHTIVGILIVAIFLLPACKVYKINKEGKQVETWNTRHLKYIHHSLKKNTFFVKNEN